MALIANRTGTGINKKYTFYWSLAWGIRILSTGVPEGQSWDVVMWSDSKRIVTKCEPPPVVKCCKVKYFFHFLPLLSRVFESKCQNDALFYFHTPKINYVKAQHKILYQLATSEADWKCDGGGGCKIYKKILPPYWMPTPLPFTIMWFDWIWFEHHLIEFVQMLPPRIELLVCIFSIFE